MKTLFAISLLVFAGLLASCGTKTEAITNTYNGSGIGDIVGFVKVYDTLYQQMKDNSGVNVSLDGTQFSSLSGLSGKWQLMNIPAGSYKITFSKDHYALYKNYNITVTGNGTYYYDYATILPLPSLYPTLTLRGFDTSTKSATFSTHSQPVYNGNPVRTMIYFSKNSVIDFLDINTYSYISEIGRNDSDSTGTANIIIPVNSLYASGFSSGVTIYCCAFATTDIVLSYAYWTDPETEQRLRVGWSPNHSEVKSFILP